MSYMKTLLKNQPLLNVLKINPNKAINTIKKLFKEFNNLQMFQINKSYLNLVETNCNIYAKII